MNTPTNQQRQRSTPVACLAFHKAKKVFSQLLTPLPRAVRGYYCTHDWGGTRRWAGLRTKCFYVMSVGF